MTILRDTPFLSQVPQIMTLDGPHQQTLNLQLCLNVPFPSICSLKKSRSHQICHIHVKSLHHYKLHSVFGPDEFGRKESLRLQGCGQEGVWEEERKILSCYCKRQSFTFSKFAKNLSCIFFFLYLFIITRRKCYYLEQFV